jgi:hypothetical protein
VCCFDMEFSEATSQAGMEGKRLYMAVKWGSIEGQSV